MGGWRNSSSARGDLLPGGGDLSPALYGDQVADASVYDVDDEQDAFDLALARWALDAGVPLLAVCRGWQLVNVALGRPILEVFLFALAIFLVLAV